MRFKVLKYTKDMMSYLNLLKINSFWSSPSIEMKYVDYCDQKRILIRTEFNRIFL